MSHHQVSPPIFKKLEDKRIIQTLSTAFLENQRMRLLVGKKGKYLAQGIQKVIAYCYFMVKKMGGVFVSKDQATYLFYYLKSDYYFSFKDILNYFHLAIFVIGLKRLKTIYSREQLIKQIRRIQIQKRQDQDFLYVWFLASAKKEKSINGLMEAKKFILQKANRLNLPIYMETTEVRLVKIYERIGFEMYDYINDQKTGLKIWFGRYEAVDN